MREALSRSRSPLGAGIEPRAHPARASPPAGANSVASPTQPLCPGGHVSASQTACHTPSVLG